MWRTGPPNVMWKWHFVPNEIIIDSMWQSRDTEKVKYPALNSCAGVCWWPTCDYRFYDLSRVSEDLLQQSFPNLMFRDKERGKGHWSSTFRISIKDKGGRPGSMHLGQRICLICNHGATNVSSITPLHGFFLWKEADKRRGQCGPGIGRKRNLCNWCVMMTCPEMFPVW